MKVIQYLFGNRTRDDLIATRRIIKESNYFESYKTCKEIIRNHIRGKWTHDNIAINQKKAILQSVIDGFMYESEKYLEQKVSDFDELQLKRPPIQEIYFQYRKLAHTRGDDFKIEDFEGFGSKEYKKDSDCYESGSFKSRYAEMNKLINAELKEYVEGEGDPSKMTIYERREWDRRIRAKLPKPIALLRAFVEEWKIFAKEEIRIANQNFNKNLTRRNSENTQIDLKALHDKIVPSCRAALEKQKLDKSISGVVLLGILLMTGCRVNEIACDATQFRCDELTNKLEVNGLSKSLHSDKWLPVETLFMTGKELFKLIGMMRERPSFLKKVSDFNGDLLKARHMAGNNAAKLASRNLSKLGYKFLRWKDGEKKIAEYWSGHNLRHIYAACHYQVARAMADKNQSFTIEYVEKKIRHSGSKKASESYQWIAFTDDEYARNAVIK